MVEAWSVHLSPCWLPNCALAAIIAFVAEADIPPKDEGGTSCLVVAIALFVILVSGSVYAVGIVDTAIFALVLVVLVAIRFAWDYFEVLKPSTAERAKTAFVNTLAVVVICAMIGLFFLIFGGRVIGAFLKMLGLSPR